MPQFNYMSLADTAGRGLRDKQTEEFNKLQMDALDQQTSQNKTTFDNKQRFENTKFIAGATKHWLDTFKKDPQRAMPLLNDLYKEGQRRGAIEPGDFAGTSFASADTGQIAEQMQQMYDASIQALKGYTDPAPTNLSASETPYAQEAFDGTITKVGATPAGATANQRDFASLLEVERQFGKDSWQYKQLAAQLVRPYYGDIAQVPTRVTATDQEPLSSLPAEADAANRVKMAEGEGGRGRSMQPDGSYAATPGTQAAIDEAAERRKRIKGARMTSIQAQTVLEDTTRLNAQLDAGTVPLGKAAAIQERLDPLLQSQDYRNAVSLIKSVEGNVGIDSLLRIKASGAGLGQVPQTQLNMLSRLLGELDLRQEPAQFRRTWNRMNQIYTEIMEISDAELAELETERPDIFTPEGGVENQAYMLRQARQAIMEGRSSRAAVIQKLQELGIDPGLL